MLWGLWADTVRSYWALTELVRCKDVWYNSFLQECRNGTLQADMYSFFHGLPTLASPSSERTCNDDVVTDAVLGKYKKSWATAFMSGSPDMSAVIADTEWSACKQVR